MCANMIARPRNMFLFVSHFTKLFDSANKRGRRHIATQYYERHQKSFKDGYNPDLPVTYRNLINETILYVPNKKKTFFQTRRGLI